MWSNNSVSNFFRGKKGFTLIELLIVIAILGILAAGVLVAINPVAQMQKARDAIRRSDARQLVDAVESYFVTNGKYPDSTCWWCYSGNGTGWIPSLVSSGEVKKLPISC